MPEANYWLFLDGKMLGPHSPKQLARIPGFSADVMICPENLSGKSDDDWLKAKDCPDFAGIFTVSPAAVSPSARRGYLVYIDGEIRGPFDIEQLKTQPVFDSGTIISPAGRSGREEGDWMRAGDCPELIAAGFFKAEIASRAAVDETLKSVAAAQFGLLMQGIQSANADKLARAQQKIEALGESVRRLHMDAMQETQRSVTLEEEIAAKNRSIAEMKGKLEEMEKGFEQVSVKLAAPATLSEEWSSKIRAMEEKIEQSEKTLLAMAPAEPVEAPPISPEEMFKGGSDVGLGLSLGSGNLSLGGVFGESSAAPAVPAAAPAAEAAAKPAASTPAKPAAVPAQPVKKPPPKPAAPPPKKSPPSSLAPIAPPVQKRPPLWVMGAAAALIVSIAAVAAWRHTRHVPVPIAQTQRPTDLESVSKIAARRLVEEYKPKGLGRSLGEVLNAMVVNVSAADLELRWSIKKKSDEVYSVSFRSDRVDPVTGAPLMYGFIADILNGTVRGDNVPAQTVLGEP